MPAESEAGSDGVKAESMIVLVVSAVVTAVSVVVPAVSVAVPEVASAVSLPVSAQFVSEPVVQRPDPRGVADLEYG